MCSILNIYHCIKEAGAGLALIKLTSWSNKNINCWLSSTAVLDRRQNTHNVAYITKLTSYNKIMHSSINEIAGQKFSLVLHNPWKHNN